MLTTGLLSRRVVPLLVILITLLGLALIGMGVGVWTARKYYLERAEVRLNPVNHGRFSSENRGLQKSPSPRIVFFGDSRVERWEPRPTDIPAELIWRGVGGETTAQMLYRFREDALSLNSRAVVIQGGINDVVLGAALGRSKEAGSTAVANLLTMATLAADTGMDVYLLTVVRPARPSILRRIVWNDDIYDVVDSMNHELRAVRHERIFVVDADNILTGNSFALPGPMSAGTLHLSATAYAALNERITQAVLASSHAVQ